MSTFTDAERDAQDLAKLVNENTTVQTRYGDQPKKSWLHIQNEINGVIQNEVDKASNLYSATIYESTSDALSGGLFGFSNLISGSGGTDGVYNLIITGDGSGAVGYFEVSSGSLVNITITNQGVNYTSASFDFSNSSGLTGASADAVISQNVPSGKFFSVSNPLNSNYLDLYKNNAGVAEFRESYPSIEIIKSYVDSCSIVNLFKFNDYKTTSQFSGTSVITIDSLNGFDVYKSAGGGSSTVNSFTIKRSAFNTDTVSFNLLLRNAINSSNSKFSIQQYDVSDALLQEDQVTGFIGENQFVNIQSTIDVNCTYMVFIMRAGSAAAELYISDITVFDGVTLATKSEIEYEKSNSTLKPDFEFTDSGLVDTGHAKKTETTTVQYKNAIRFNNSLVELDAMDRTPVYTAMHKLPDASGTNPSGGFTCTGLDRDSRGFWIVGNDGRTNPSDTTYDSSIVILSTDFSTVIDEIDVKATFPTLESIQGVAYDESDNTIWFVDKTNAIIRHVNFAGVDQGDEIAVAFTPNGIARDPENDALWVSKEGEPLALLLDCDTGNQISAVDFPTIADQMHYDANSKYLWVTYGGNAIDGLVRVYDVLKRELINQTEGLKFAQAIEGIFVEDNKVYIVNDGGFHTTATPPLNLAIEYEIDKPITNKSTNDEFYFNLCAQTLTNTSADFLIGFGDPLDGGVGEWGVYVADENTLRLIISNDVEAAQIFDIPCETRSVFNLKLSIYMTANTITANINSSPVTISGAGDISTCNLIRYGRINIGGQVPFDRGSHFDLIGYHASEDSVESDDVESYFNGEYI